MVDFDATQTSIPYPKFQMQNGSCVMACSEKLEKGVLLSIQLAKITAETHIPDNALSTYKEIYLIGSDFRSIFQLTHIHASCFRLDIEHVPGRGCKERRGLVRGFN